MKEDFGSIQILAERWWRYVEDSDFVSTPYGRVLSLGSSSNIMDATASGDLSRATSQIAHIVTEGDRITSLIEEESKGAPGAIDIKLALCNHLNKIGEMNRRAISSTLLTMSHDEFKDHLSDLKTDDEITEASWLQCIYIHTHTASYASRLCESFTRSYGMLPNADAAYELAKIFEQCGFYGTALHWLRLAINCLPQDSDAAQKLEVTRMQWSAHGTEDPAISQRSDYLFPRDDTPGLQTEFQIKAEAKLEEAHRLQQIELARQADVAKQQKDLEAERQRREAERQRRIETHLCIQCGKSLNLIERIKSMTEHQKCKV